MSSRLGKIYSGECTSLAINLIEDNVLKQDFINAE
jgi:hypothetical protein